MNKPKKKIFNFRPVLCVAVLMILAVLLACLVFVTQTARLVILCVLFAFIVCRMVLLLVCKKKIFKTILFILIPLLIPVLSIYIKAERVNANNALNAENCVIYGKIYKIKENLDKNYVDVYLADVELFSDVDKLDFYGNYLLRINSNNFDVSKLELGRFVKCKGAAELCNLSSGDRGDLSFMARDVMGFSYVFSYNVFVTDEFKPTLRDQIKSKAYSYFEKTDLFFTGVGYAMMFGDSSMLDDSVYCVFELSGTVHLLAVSGFHVSIIVSFILFVLKKLKANKASSFIISAALVSFYAYLCGFSVSVVRAGIMSLIAILASMKNKECDRLSSMSLAVILILMFNPLDLFNISFVLSFVAVLSIILLVPIFERLFSKIFSDKLSSLLSLSISTSIGISCFQLYYFGKAPILSFLSNLITVPLVSALFVFLLISVLIGSIFGLAVPLIGLFGIGIKYVLQINNWIANIGLFILSNNVRDITLLLSVLLMYAVSDYLFVKRKNKLVLVSLIGGLLLSLLIF